MRECPKCVDSPSEVIGILYFMVKVCCPLQHLNYLGVQFDTISMTTSLPKNKLAKLHQELNFFENKDRATKKQIQRLCGVVAHCSKVMKGGRTFSRRIMDMLKGLPKRNKRIRLSQDFKHDLDWWKEFSARFNGTTTD